SKSLRSDIEYKTLGITFQTTCREVVTSLLNKYRMRHRDPNLFFLTMEVTVRRSGVRTILVLDEETRPAALQSCHPRGDSKFCLQTRRGALVKIYDSAIMPEVCESQEFQRKLHHDDNVLHVQSCWPSMQEFHFLIRRNPDYRSRSKSKISWTPELPSIPSSSRLSLSQPETASTSLLADYDNYFYI
ncbi:hypothetical protein WDU94_008818, partial [Cyamophila willieti]